MNYILNTCKVVNNLFNKGDEMDGMQMLHNLFILYQTKYEIKPTIHEIEFETEFRNDTKVIFKTLHNCVASDECMKFMETEFDDNNEADQKDKKKFLNFIDNINFILQKIDTVDLHNPDEDFHTNCRNAMSYFNQKNTDMKELTNKMKILSKQVELNCQAFTRIYDTKLKLD